MEDEYMKKAFIYSMAGLAMAATALGAESLKETPAAVTTINAEQLDQTSINEDILKRLSVLEEGQPSSKIQWASKVRVKGDLRYRYEVVKKDNDTSKNRQRIRARLGAYAEVNDFTDAGIRIRTGQEANSGNQTIGSDFDGKGVYLDLAYMTLSPEDSKYGAVTLGKMKYPWKVTTDMIWDSDVNPEGGVYTYGTSLDGTALFGSAGYFKVQDTSETHDLNLGSAQLGATQKLSDSAKATVGGSFFAYDNAKDFLDPSTGSPPTANYMVDYQIVELFGEVGCKKIVPVGAKLYGNYVNNVAESNENQGYCLGIKFGDAKKGKWEAKFGYRDLDQNAAPAYFADSDYAGGGTDIKGFRFKGKYNICKNLQAGATFIAGEQKSSSTDVDTLHLDIIASF
jgi:hypothetical protein